MQGWIKLHRKLIEWEWYKDSKMVHLFIYLLLMANHQDGQWQGIPVKKGQFITGLDSLNKATGISIQSLRTCLSKLESTGELTSKSTNRFRILTLCNYTTYQLSDWDTNKPTNKQSTNNQQATNKQLTANNNDNNENNDNNVKSGTVFTLEQVQNSGFLLGISDEQSEAFFNHYNSQGWVRGNGLPITDIASMLTIWRNNQYKFDSKDLTYTEREEKAKVKLAADRHERIMKNVTERTSTC